MEEQKVSNQTPQPTVEPIQPIQQRKQKKTLLIALGFILLSLAVAFLAGGYFLGKYQSTKKLAAVTTTVDPTQTYSVENWKRYRNEDYSFELMYPDIWVTERLKGDEQNAIKIALVPPQTSQEQLDQGEYIQVDVQKCKSVSCTEELNRFNDLKNRKTLPTSYQEADKKTTSETFRVVSGTSSTGEFSESAYFFTNGEFFLLSVGNKKLEKIYNDILRTFKFIGSVQGNKYGLIDTSNWKIYTAEDPEFGIKTSLKLPPGFSFSFSGSEFIIQDNNDDAEVWRYTTSITADGGNTYSGQSKKVWYEEYLQGKHGGVSVAHKNLVDTVDRNYNNTSYIEASVNEGAMNVRHFLYVKNGILNIIVPSSNVAYYDSAVIANNIGPIIESINVVQTK